jgi:NDP-sugar pyrophosphorylase family protein
MRAMILAAGRGTRLASLEPEVPKPLVRIGEHPILEHQLRFLVQLGVDHVVVNAHHLAPLIERFVERRARPPHVTVLVEPHLLGTAGGVRNALELLGNDPFLVVYGDVLLTEPLESLVAAHHASGASATACVYESASTEGKGVIEVDGIWATRFVEKGGVGPGLVNAGIYVVEPSVIERLPRGSALDFGLDVFPVLAREDRGLAVARLRSPLIDIGTPEGLAAARALVE